MSKRSREYSTTKKHKIQDPFDDIDDLSDEDYVPSDEEFTSRGINPNDTSRNRIKTLPPHLSGYVNVKNLNKVHLELFTSTDLEKEDNQVNWQKERSILLFQIIENDQEEITEKKLVRTYATHISNFLDSDPVSNNSSLPMSHGDQSLIKKEEEKQPIEKDGKKNRVLLRISCFNNSKIDINLKFFIDGKELTHMETIVQKRNTVIINGYDDLENNLRKKLVINKYEPPIQFNNNTATTYSISGSNIGSSSNSIGNDKSEECGGGVIMIQVYKADRNKVEKDYSSDSSSGSGGSGGGGSGGEDHIVSSNIEKVNGQLKQSDKQQKQCGMQVGFQASSIKRPNKKVKRGRKSKSEIRFTSGKLLFQSNYRYRSYLGFLCELDAHSIDLGKMTNTAKGRVSSDDEESSEDHESLPTTPPVINQRVKSENLIIEIPGEDEPQKVIPTISLESDEEEDKTSRNEKNFTSSSTQNTQSIEYKFRETIEEINGKSVDDLILFIKLNDEDLYHSIRNTLKTCQITGRKFMNLRLIDMNQFKENDQFKMLQIISRIHSNTIH